MPAPPLPPTKRHSRHVPPRPRLFIAAGIGAAAAWMLPGRIGSILRVVIGWDVGVGVFLILSLVMAARATAASMRRRAESEDLARWAFLVLMAGAALFSMFAILGMLHEARGSEGHPSTPLILLGATTILLSWLFANIAFAIHYAHDFYRDGALGRAPGLDFPGEPDTPNYWDFAYFSLVVGMTCQVSDVRVMTPPWRRLVLAHGFMAFLFNTVVLALSINLIAGLL